MRVAVTSKAFSTNSVLVGELEQHFKDVKLNLTGKLLEGQQLHDFLVDRDVAIIAMEQMTPQVLDKLPLLKVISKFGVGLNNIDLLHCQKRGIEVKWTSGVNKCSVAEMALGFMLMMIRNLYLTSTQLSAGKWNKSGGQSLYGKTIGIIGLGHIGQELVRLLMPFKCKILINDIVDKSKFCLANGLTVVSKDELLSMSDIITIHAPLNDETNQMINSESFAKMKNNAYLINTARGGLVNLSDLKNALTENQIAGAAIDVYDSEPPQDLELLSLSNLICTPHIGGNSKEATLAMGRSAITHLRS